MTSGEGETKTLNIVVIGAGLVGAFSAVALSRLPHVKLTVYEKADGPSELGAWIGLPESSTATLSRFVDNKKLQEITYRGPLDRYYVTRHWRTGEVLRNYKPSLPRLNDYYQSRTHRVPLHNLILSYVPEGVIEYGFTFKEVKVNANDVEIYFENKEPVHADLLIAADGIYSKIRRQFTNDVVQYKGSVAYRNVFDESVVKDIPGLPNDTSVWVSGNGHLFLSRLGLGKYGIVAGLREPPEVASKLKWNGNTGSWGKKHLQEHFKDWDPIVGEVFKAIPEIQAYPLESAPWLKDLILHDRIAFIGDAAHPTAGAYGAGAAMGFDDVWAIYRSLSETSTFSDHKVNDSGEYNLKKALFLFNETRKHFLQRVELQTKLDPVISKKYINAAKTDEDWKIRTTKANSGLGWLLEHNVELEFQQARDRYFLELFVEE